MRELDETKYEPTEPTAFERESIDKSDWPASAVIAYAKLEESYDYMKAQFNAACDTQSAHDREVQEMQKEIDRLRAELEDALAANRISKRIELKLTAELAECKRQCEWERVKEERDRALAALEKAKYYINLICGAEKLFVDDWLEEIEKCESGEKT